MKSCAIATPYENPAQAAFTSKAAAFGWPKRCKIAVAAEGAWNGKVMVATMMVSISVIVSLAFLRATSAAHVAISRTVSSLPAKRRVSIPVRC